MKDKLPDANDSVFEILVLDVQTKYIITDHFKST